MRTDQGSENVPIIVFHLFHFNSQGIQQIHLLCTAVVLTSQTLENERTVCIIHFIIVHNR
jgi:hypothetical protein